MRPESSELDASRPAWSEGGSIDGLESGFAGDFEAPDGPHGIGGAHGIDGREVGDAAERYTEGHEIGSGGMGRIVMARDVRLARDVAVKEAREPEVEALLMREARIVGRLEHPGIVPIYDLGRRADGTLFFVMRVVRGRSLAAALSEVGQGAMAARLSLLRHVLDVCEAVGWAHTRGVVHRDLKPANIMIGGYGETQVIDWGLASAAGEAELRGVVGTPSYMAPEQALGAAPDARADVFSLGVILAELALPGAARAGDQGQAGRAESLPVALRELAAIIARARAADPAARYPDAKALADDLARYLDGRPVAAYAYTARDALRRFVRAWRRPLIVIGLVVAAALTLVVVALVQSNAARDAALVAEEAANRALARALVDEACVAAERGDRAEAELAAARSLVLVESPEARAVLAAFGRATRPRLLTRQTLPSYTEVALGPAGEALCVTGGGFTLFDTQASEPRWRREGTAQNAAFIDAGRVVVVQRGDGQLQPLVTATGAPLGGGWRRSAGTLVAGDDGAFALQHIGNREPLLMAADGDRTAATAMPLARVGPVVLAGVVDHGFVALALSDGRLDLGVIGGPLTPTEPFYQGINRTVTRMIVTPNPRREGAWRLLLGLSDGSIETLTLGDAPALGGEAARPEPLAVGAPGIVRRLAARADGRVLAVLGEDARVALFDGVTGRRLDGLPGANWRAIRFLADGTLVAAGATLDRWAIDPTRAAVQRFAGGVPSLAIVPGGAAVTVAAGNELLTVASADGAVTVRAVWQDLLVKAVAWTPDGTTLYTESIGDLDVRAWTDGIPRVVSPQTGVRHFAVLADGQVLLQLSGVGLDRLEPYARLMAIEMADLQPTPDGRAAAWVAADGTFGLALPGPTPSGETDVVTVARVPGTLAAYPWMAVRHELDEAGEAGIFTAGYDGVTAWSADGKVLRYFAAPRAELVSVAANGAGRVAAGARDGSVWLWDVASGRLVARFRDHRERVAALAFGPDGRWLVTGSFDRTLRFRDLTLLDAEPSALLDQICREWGEPRD